MRLLQNPICFVLAPRPPRRTRHRTPASSSRLRPRIWSFFISLKTKGHGFTFLEIVVVLFILGLLLLLIYPKFQSLTEDGLQTASRHLVGVIQYLYHETIATRKIHRLSYDLKASEYRVSVVNSNGELASPAPLLERRVSLPRGVTFQDVVTLHQGKVTEGEAYTQFFPVGLAEKTVIHLADRGKRVFTLEINPLTGRVKVYEGYIEVKEVVSSE